MGDYSRDPRTRLSESVAKHYVGVRLQQGVPLLDADWNELDDLRRHELASVVARFIGDGVPSGNDGFRIDALPEGGVGTIVLEATPQSGLAYLSIDLAASTAAGGLGFTEALSATVHTGTANARLVSAQAEPFRLSDGVTLTVESPAGRETVTFSATDVDPIDQATAADVVVAINDALSGVTASVGTGNDLLVQGGDGSVLGAGRLLVEGTETQIESDIVYSTQPLYQNTALADAWDVDVLPALTAATTATRTDLVYLDVWEREIGAEEDDALVLPEVGVETARRLRREWVVRVAEGASSLTAVPHREGHRYVALAQLTRTPSDGAELPSTAVRDVRKRGLTLSEAIVSPIYVPGPSGIDRVNSGLFETLLQTTSTVYSELLDSDLFLGDNFSTLTASESVQVLRSFQDVRFLAEAGVTDARLQRFDNEAALGHLRRLYEAQAAFVDTLAPLAALSGDRAATLLLVQDLEGWLETSAGTTDGLRAHVMPDEDPDLGDAYDAQAFINNEVGRRTGILPQGLLRIQPLDIPSATIQAGQTYTFAYSIRSELNVDETVRLALADTEGAYTFAFTGLDPDPTDPSNPAKASVQLVAGGAAVNAGFTLTVPAGTPSGTASRIVFSATSVLNPEDVDYANLEIEVVVGETTDQPSDLLEFDLGAPDVNVATETVEVGTSGGDFVVFRFDMRYLVSDSVSDTFALEVDFIGSASSFEVLGSTTLDPFTLQGAEESGGTLSDPVSRDVPIAASASASDGDQSLMIVRLVQDGVADPIYREQAIRIEADLTA